MVVHSNTGGRKEGGDEDLFFEAFSSFFLAETPSSSSSSSLLPRNDSPSLLSPLHIPATSPLPHLPPLSEQPETTNQSSKFETSFPFPSPLNPLSFPCCPLRFHSPQLADYISLHWRFRSLFLFVVVIFSSHLLLAFLRDDLMSQIHGLRLYVTLLCSF